MNSECALTLFSITESLLLYIGVVITLLPAIAMQHTLQQFFSQVDTRLPPETESSVDYFYVHTKFPAR